MLYNSYQTAIKEADFTFARLTQFREEAQTEGAYQYTPDLASKATRIVEQAETNFANFDDFTQHGVMAHHVWSVKDPAIYAALRFNLGQSARMDLDQLRADTAQLTLMIRDLYAFRGRVAGMISMYKGWAEELEGKRDLKSGEAHTLDAIEHDVVPMLESLMPRINYVIRSFEEEERERYKRISQLGNMIFIMRGGFTGRFARFNPNHPDKAAAAAAAAAAQDVDEKAELEKKAAEAKAADPTEAAAQHAEPQHAEPQPADADAAPLEAAPQAELEAPQSAAAQTAELDRGRRDERRPNARKRRGSSGDDDGAP